MLFKNAYHKEQKRQAALNDPTEKVQSQPSAEHSREGSQPLFVSDQDDKASQGSSYNMTPAPAKRTRKASLKQAEKRRLKQGIEAGLEKPREKAKRKGRKSNTQAPKGKPKSGKRKNDDPADETEKKSKRRKRGVKEAVNSGNLYSSTNVGADANRNLGRDIPHFTNRKKKEAFNELIATTPLEDRNDAVLDKQNLWQSMSILGKNRCRLEANGSGFSLTGVNASIRPFQVLGAAFMKERERGPDKPLGGICADELGFGKTLQMLMW